MNAILHATKKSHARDARYALPSNFASSIGRSDRAAQLIWHGLADSTCQGGETIRLSFSRFVFSLFGQKVAFPAQEQWLVEWVAAQDSQQRGYHAIRRDIYLLKSWHVDLGASVLGFVGGQLERAFRGMKRLRGVQPAQAKLAITLPLLRQLLRQLPTLCKGQDYLSYRAAFSLAFACFLRSGELTYNTFNPSLHLLVSSVQFGADHAIVTIPASKTDPFRQGVKVVAPQVFGLECPFTALRDLTAHRPPHLPLFSLSSSSSFSRSQFLTILQRSLEAANVPTTGYSGHSFCRGAATWATANGCSEDDIRVMGRWNSACARRYIDRSATERSNMVCQLYLNRHGPLQPSSSTWRNF